MGHDRILVDLEGLLAIEHREDIRAVLPAAIVVSVREFHGNVPTASTGKSSPADAALESRRDVVVGGLKDTIRALGYTNNLVRSSLDSGRNDASSLLGSVQERRMVE